MKNSLNWFEIPVADFDRAHRFYSIIYAHQLPIQESDGYRMAMFQDTMEQEGVGGAIVAGAGQIPGPAGAKVYLNLGDNLDEILARVEPAGGKIVIPATKMPEYGSYAVFEDTEGNHVGVHTYN
ncbi:hypothetical protein SAMN05421823_102582 [Catalinimonas alkaloidigena]|uniref:VOC domain-containing protein n=1 Tax=Catalinimonas alkaloidigena TaxID=1075417 RepID=A0A1G9BD02_9BACT|nr:VOC family protein [Catalinimonas alkaloidigena]SDK37363.1 hypothetical protein SAMN05421823_102582 [Catalinimonas alkaloidigena]